MSRRSVLGIDLPEGNMRLAMSLVRTPATGMETTGTLERRRRVIPTATASTLEVHTDMVNMVSATMPTQGDMVIEREVCLATKN